MIINIHSHGPATGEEWVLKNVFEHFDRLPGTGWYSMGLHPWYLRENDWKGQLALLRAKSEQPNVLAIGECGLDKVCPTDPALQKLVFTEQVKLANEIGKPLIIHCVRAFDDVLSVLKHNGNKVPVIFHGFYRGLQLANKLLGEGHYLSFGKALDLKTLQQVLKQLPPDRIFLETDDASISIESRYQLAAESLQIGQDSLSLQIQKNAVTVFGPAPFHYDN